MPKTYEDSFFATIYTDASYCHQRKISTFAYFIKTSKGRIEDSGEEVGVQDVNHAEMLGIYRAVQRALKEWPELQGLFINTDSLCCCHILWPFKETKKDHKSHRAVNGGELIKELLGDRWFRTKHVKAHTGDQDMRSRLNRLVDRNSKKVHRSKRRKENQHLADDADREMCGVVRDWK